MSQLVQTCCGFPNRRPVHGQRSLNRVSTVARSGNTTFFPTRRDRVLASLGSSWPGGSNKISGARPFGMPFKRLTLSWLAGAIAMSAAVYQGALANALPTGENSLSLELSDQTATQTSGEMPTRSPVNITLFYPTQGVDPDLPWVMMMNGANCYGNDYTYLLRQLASKGYLTVAPTQFHPAPPRQEGKDLLKDQADQCDKDSFVIITASLVNDVHNLLKTLSSSDLQRLLPIPQIQPETTAALKTLDADSIVLVAHSAGGVTAVDMLTGKCAEKGMAEQVCGNYTTITNRQGRNALKGAVAFEGYGASGVQIPDGMFLTYMAGQYNKQAEEKFNTTKGDCIQYVELAGGNHYAITDWNPDTAPHQKAPCAANIPHDDPDFKTTQSEQEERLDFIASYTDAMVRTAVLNDKAAASYLLHDVANSHLVRKAKVSSSCVLASSDGKTREIGRKSVQQSVSQV